MQIAHSPVAWEHVLFKDVAVKVSNLEVYYRAVSFYLAEHPDLLVDLLKASSSPAGSDKDGHTCLFALLPTGSPATDALAAA